MSNTQQTTEETSCESRNVVTYSYAYRSGKIDLCDACAKKTDGLAAVQHGRHFSRFGCAGV